MKKWITNMQDPQIYIDTALNEWIKTVEVGLPKATDTHTIEELQKEGIVGIYQEDNIQQDNIK